MSDNFIPLDSIQVATPCRADWDKMRGDGATRFCQSCEKNVYNLSMMSRDEAQALIQAKGRDMCARFYRRADGTIMTTDCTVGMNATGLRPASSPLRWLGAAAVALLAVGTSGCGSTGPSSSPFAFLRNVQPFKMVLDKVSPAPPPMVMGAMVCPTPPPGTTPTPQPAREGEDTKPTGGHVLGRTKMPD